MMNVRISVWNNGNSAVVFINIVEQIYFHSYDHIGNIVKITFCVALTRKKSKFILFPTTPHH